jgi:hypothetical protein
VLTALLQAHPFESFYITALAIAALVVVARQVFGKAGLAYGFDVADLAAFATQQRSYINVRTIALFSRQQPVALLIFAFAAAPSVAAVAVAAAGGGGGIGSLLWRVAPWHGVPALPAIATYGIATAVMVGVGYWFLEVHRRREPQQYEESIDRLGGSLRRAFLLIVRGFFIDEGGTCEELGWRGFAIPVLIASWAWSPWLPTVVIGVLWWFWHFPREMPGLVRTGPSPRWARGQLVFMTLCVAMSIVCTTTVLLTGSFWPALMIHGGTNVWSKAVTQPKSLYLGTIEPRTAILGVSAALCLIAYWITTGHL